VDEVSVNFGRDAVSLGIWFVTFQGNVVISPTMVLNWNLKSLKTDHYTVLKR